ncbi:hypothetical protein V6Z12_A01G069700 [Gossypium hirsutum]
MLPDASRMFASLTSCSIIASFFADLVLLF